MAKKKTSPDTSLVVLVDQAKLSEADSQRLLEKFKVVEETVTSWRKKSELFVITDVSQTADMEACKAGYDFLNQKYKEIESTRKELKEPYLRPSQAIDGIANHFKALLEPLMEELKSKAEFAKTQGKKLLQEKGEARLKLLEPYGVYLTIEDAATMLDDVFEAYLEIAKKNFEERPKVTAEVVIMDYSVPKVEPVWAGAASIGVIGEQAIFEQAADQMNDFDALFGFGSLLANLNFPDVTTEKAIEVMQQVEQNILDSVNLINQYINEVKQETAVTP